MFFFLTIYNSVFSKNIIKLYTQYTHLIKEEKFIDAISILKQIEKKAVNKNFYRIKILFFSNLINDSIEFKSTILRLEKGDSLQINKMLENNFNVIPNWKKEFLNINQNKRKINETLVLKFAKLYENEIMHRTKIAHYYTELKIGNINYERFKFLSDSIFELQKPIDKMNHKLFDKIIDSIGYIPGLDELSLSEIKTVYTIMQHYNNNNTKKKYINMIKKQMKKGCFPYLYYTQIVDRYRQGIGKTILFGQTVKINVNGEKEINGNFNINKVNKNRIKFGLGTI